MTRTPAEFITIPENPVPPGADCFTLDRGDGHFARVAVFPCPDHKPARGAITLVTGRSEFIEKYFEVIGDLHQRGLNVVVMDWRGQGLSSRYLDDRYKGHVASFDDFVSDLRLVLHTVTKETFAGPYLLLSHSMGGVPALQLLGRGALTADGEQVGTQTEAHDPFIDEIAGAILVAPMTHFFPGQMKRDYVRLLTKAAVAAGFANRQLLGVKEHSLSFEGNVLTSDAKRHARFKALQDAKPEAMIFSPTYGWLNAATTAIEEIHSDTFKDKMRTPVMIVSAENDMLIDAGDHRQLAQWHPNITCVTVKGAMHEILMEDDHYRDQFWEIFDTFVEERLAATP
ncbi:MAG: alpha/beta hydrolase [Pseudomonadota bacterium]